jgi:hypothetical protein
MFAARFACQFSSACADRSAHAGALHQTARRAAGRPLPAAVREASAGEPVRPGTSISPAATGIWKSMRTENGSDGRSRLGHRPSYAGRSAPQSGAARKSLPPCRRRALSHRVAVYGSGVLGVVLTGMGSDGLARMPPHSRAWRHCVLAQDQATSAVWGMPGAVAQAGLAHRILPLNADRPRDPPAGTAGANAKPSSFGNRLCDLLNPNPSQARPSTPLPPLTPAVDCRLQLSAPTGLRTVAECPRPLARLPLRNPPGQAAAQPGHDAHGRADSAPAPQARSGAERSIAEAMTINETSFFRDSRPFELLRKELLPR